LKRKLSGLRVITFGSHSPVIFTSPEYIELSISPQQEGIRLLYEQCDLWLCCSLSEGFGLTILEVMACRTSSVSTRCGGPGDIIDEGVNGYLCEVGDIDGLTEASYTVLNFSEEKWLCFSNESYQRANAYSWHDAAELFERALLD